jgi:hypothetical protein
MNLPNGFRSFEHLQDTIRREHNALIKRYFSDHPQDWTPNIDNPRSSLRTAVQMFDDDTAEMTLIRLYLFYDVIGYGRKNLATYYGSKFDNGTPPVSDNPQLFLYFQQDELEAEASRIDCEKTCRLAKFSTKLGESLPAITQTNLIDLAREVKAQFTSGNRGITFTTGKTAVSYSDPKNGFPKGNYFLVNSKTEGVELYRKLTNVVDVPFDETKIKVSVPEKNSTNLSTQKDTILGKQYSKRRYRPVGNVRFKYAYVSFGNVAPPIFLVDLTYRNPAIID